jgi:hypothetical protein
MRPADRGFGIAGSTHLWTCNSTGLFELLDANSRRRTAIVELGELPRAILHLPLTVSRDGRSVFILHGLGSTETHLRIVDIVNGKVTAAHAGLPPMMWRAPLERPDGRLLLSERGARLILLDPTTRMREDSQVSGNAALPGFIGASPSVAGASLFAACALALLVGVATGLLPGLQSARMSPLHALGGARGTVGGRSMIRNVLVGVQVAVSLLLLIGALLLVGSFLRVSPQDPGFAASRVATGAISLPTRRYADPIAQSTLYERLREELGRAPGVHSATILAGLPLSGFLSRAPYVRADRVVPLNQRPLGPTRSVTPGYFATMGIPLRAGRDFTPRDDAAAPQVVISSASAASRLFRNEDPFRRVILSGSQNGGIPVEIVGSSATGIR